MGHRRFAEAAVVWAAVDQQVGDVHPEQRGLALSDGNGDQEKRPEQVSQSGNKSYAPTDLPKFEVTGLTAGKPCKNEDADDDSQGTQYSEARRILTKTTLT